MSAIFVALSIVHTVSGYAQGGRADLGVSGEWVEAFVSPARASTDYEASAVGAVEACRSSSGEPDGCLAAGWDYDYSDAGE